MNGFVNWFDKFINYVIAFALALMAIFVFGNVILRYFFHSGLTWAEEISRFLFIWLIFLGSILAFKDNEHLGIVSLIARLSLKGKKILFIVNNVLIFITLVMLLDGTWNLVLINVDQSSPALQIPYAYVYISGAFMAVAMLIIVAIRLYKLLTNKIDENDLVMTTDSEEKADFSNDDTTPTHGGEK
jgi:TRAP-type C4-dicarboxylate transport system permease small subunit